MKGFILVCLLPISFFIEGQTPEIVIPVGHKFGLNSAIFSSDDKLILTSGADKNINIWDAETGLLIKSIQHDVPIFDAFFSKDKKFIIASTYIGVAIWETLTGKLTLKFDSGFTISSNLSPDNKFLLTLSDLESTINLWNFQSGEHITKFTGVMNGLNRDKIFIQNTRNRFISNNTILPSPIEMNKYSTMAIGISSDTTVGIWNLKTGKWLHNLLHHSKVTSIKFSKDGWHVYTTDATALHIWDAMSGKLLKDLNVFKSVPQLSASITEVVFSEDGSIFLSRSYDKSMLTIWETATGNQLGTLADSPSYIKINFSHDGKKLVVATKENSTKIFNYQDGALIKEIIGSSKVLLAKFNHDKSKIGIAHGKDVLVIDMATGFLANRFSGHTADISSLTFGPNGDLISSGSHDNSIKLWSLANGVLKQTFAENFPVLQLNFDRAGTSIYSSTGRITDKKWSLINGHQVDNDYDIIGGFSLIDQNGFGIPYTDTKIEFNSTNIKSKRIYKYTFNELRPWMGGMFSTSTISKNGKFLAIQFPADSLRIYNVQSGAVIKSIQETTESFKSKYWTTYTAGAGYFGISPDSIHFFNGYFSSLNSAEFSDDNEKLVFVSIESKSRIYDLVTDKIRVYDGAIQGVDWKKYLAIVLENNILYIKDLNTNKNLLTWTPIGDAEYIITHPSGLFDASPGAMEKLYFVQGLDLIDFRQLKSRYYEPGLWKKVMNGEKLRNVVGMKSIDLPPDIRIGKVDDKGYLQIDLTNRGGGIGEVNVFVNGKEVIKDARGANTKPDAPNASIKVFIGKHKSIVKGQENFIAAKAWNKDHWVQSRGQVVSYHSKEIEQYKPAIHILTCGISDYIGGEIDLKYAAKDANDMSKAIQLGAKKLFGTDKCYVYNLTTSGSKENIPTKENILKTFTKISATAHPLDVFVIYLSGHGINYGGSEGDWHYLTQDAYTSNAGAYDDPAIREQTTISSNELVELFKKVPALKQVLLIDACASGKVVDNFRAKKDIESNTLRALDRMRDRTGVHIITGCTADAVSYEASKYGQGVLTYSLLEGIRGAALREDQYVDINKLFHYAQDRVPQLAEGIGGIQSPQIFSPQGGQSFDIGLLSESEKQEIPIAKIRPVYIRSNFQDENELEDVLNLGKMVDNLLNDASSKGTEATLIFVDVREYPEGCKLIGRYKRENGKIMLTLKKRCEGSETTVELTGLDIQDLGNQILHLLTK